MDRESVGLSALGSDSNYFAEEAINELSSVELVNKIGKYNSSGYHSPWEAKTCATFSAKALKERTS